MGEWVCNIYIFFGGGGGLISEAAYKLQLMVVGVGLETRLCLWMIVFCFFRAPYPVDGLIKDSQV